MSICLIRPPAVFSRSAYSTPLGMPLGVAYLTSTLLKAGMDVTPIDGLGEGIENIHFTPDNRFKVQGLTEDQILSKIPKNASIIGLSIMFSQEWPFLKPLLQNIRHSFPNAKIILGGEHVTALSEFCLRDRPEVDYVIRGEGELTFLELVRAIQSDQPVSELPGVAYLSDGEFRQNALSPRVIAIDEMPWPAWHLFNLEAYFQPNYTIGVSYGRNMAMLATRGCPHQCTFCSSPGMWTTRYVLRSPKDVIDEMEFYVKQYRINMVEFYDLTAIVKKRWILEFAQELKERRLNIGWQLPAGTRSEVLDHDVLDAVAKTGLKYIAYAPESGSERVLKQVKKRVNLDNLSESVAIAKSCGLVIKINIVIGFPDETRRDVYKTLFYIWRLALKRVDDCNISFFTPYPGSELYVELRKSGELPPPGDSYFESLISQFDFTSAETFCRNIPSIELIFYRILGMGVFYLLSFSVKGSRILHIIRLMFYRKRNWLPERVFEQRISDWMARRGSPSYPAVGPRGKIGI